MIKMQQNYYRNIMLKKFNFDFWRGKFCAKGIPRFNSLEQYIFKIYIYAYLSNDILPLCIILQSFHQAGIIKKFYEGMNDKYYKKPP